MAPTSETTATTNEKMIDVVEGCLVPVRMKYTNEWHTGEVISIKVSDIGEKLYYVHFIDFNKHLDEWVTKDRINLDEMHLPGNHDGINKPGLSVSPDGRPAVTGSAGNEDGPALEMAIKSQDSRNLKDERGRKRKLPPGDPYSEQNYDAVF